jgi:glycerol-3-phosphate cytidylyltransferase
MRTGITFSAFDLFDAGCVKIFEEAKRLYDYLICVLQTDPTIDWQKKNRHLQSLVERYIQLKECRPVDETFPYATEQALEDVLCSFKIDVPIIADDYASK